MRSNSKVKVKSYLITCMSAIGLLISLPVSGEAGSYTFAPIAIN